MTKAEREIACLVATGLSNKEIAEARFTTEKTAKYHLTNIFKKLGLKSRARLIVYWLHKEQPKVILVNHETRLVELSFEPLLPVGRAA